MKTFRFLLVISSIIFLSSCATILYTPYQKVTVNSDPQGANIFVNGIDTKKVTPCEITVKRKQIASNINSKNELVYTLKKENYPDVEYRDKSKSNFLTVIDWYMIAVPGLIDQSSGANRTYADQVFVKLNDSKNSPANPIAETKKEHGNVSSSKSNAYQFEKKSDVDKTIPQTGKPNQNRFALIVGNEDYSSFQKDMTSEINVDFARNDASAFREYAINTIGIPDKNIIFLLDATTGQINQGISKLNLIIKNTQGNADVFIYYAGHGLPDETTKEAYIMPVDIDGKNARDGIKLKDLYSKITEFPSKRVTIFIDACFSGGARNQGLLAARGVKVQPKEIPLNGKLVVFTASSGNQSSLPYKDKQHGFFTYYLLKKLQESKGDLTYNELSTYIKENVALQSVLINNKEQTPQVNVSNSVGNDWGNFNIK